MTASMEAARNGTMTHVEKLLTLFKAFREHNIEGFLRTAESIIADELTANHHSEARDLQKALRNGLSQLRAARSFDPTLDQSRVFVLWPPRSSTEWRLKSCSENSTFLTRKDQSFGSRCNILVPIRRINGGVKENLRSWILCRPKQRIFWPKPRAVMPRPGRICWTGIVIGCAI